MGNVASKSSKKLHYIGTMHNAHKTTDNVLNVAWCLVPQLIFMNLFVGNICVKWDKFS